MYKGNKRGVYSLTFTFNPTKIRDNAIKGEVPTQPELEMYQLNTETCSFTR